MENLIVDFISFLMTAIVAVCGRGIQQVIPFLIGIIGGYIVAAPKGIKTIEDDHLMSKFSVQRLTGN